MWSSSLDRLAAAVEADPNPKPKKRNDDASADVIRVERRIAAQPAAVFRYLTESDLWARWQGESAELDPAPGGRFVVRMAEGQVVEGEFVTVEPDRRVVVSLGLAGPSADAARAPRRSSSS